MSKGKKRIKVTLVDRGGKSHLTTLKSLVPVIKIAKYDGSQRIYKLFNDTTYHEWTEA